WIWSVAFDPQGDRLASGSADGTVKLWDVTNRRLLHSFERHTGTVLSVAFDAKGRLLATGSSDNTVKLWDVANGRLLLTLEGHTGPVEMVAFSANGRLLASKSSDNTIRIRNCATWESIAVIPEPAHPRYWIPSLAFHPTRPLLATTGFAPDAPEKKFQQIHFWNLDVELLFNPKAESSQPTAPSVSYTSARIVLVGDSGVGKTGLGWRMAHGEFKEHSSTHGQQFWLLSDLCQTRGDGTQCEAVLWDLAGQPDYRLIHALFLDDADLALLLFDPTVHGDVLHGVEFWLNQLNIVRRSLPSSNLATNCPAVLVAARSDRGTGTLTAQELNSFCQQRGINGYLMTSARSGAGLAELISRLKELIDWEAMPATVTTDTFKRIKDYALALKEHTGRHGVIVAPDELRQRLQATDSAWTFNDAEMLTAIGHLENHGYVKRLRTSAGQSRILLQPELLNNLAASFVLEARRNERGLGALEEQQLLADRYLFQELEGLPANERAILLDSTTLLFLEHNVCFRETSPLTSESYLVFPELINQKKPLLTEERPTQDSVAYTLRGAVENVYASLTVLLGYTQTFTRTNQWRHEARYEIGSGLICGFRQEADRIGELDFVLYYGIDVGSTVRTLFQSLFESFLGRRNLTVYRYEPVVCSKGHVLNRGVAREESRAGNDAVFCPRCGEQLRLPKSDEPIQLTRKLQAEVQTQRRIADRRTQFEQAVYRVLSHVEERKMQRPTCFISYAWGDRAQERWVERSVATDLKKAGINVVLDRWENSQIGKSVPRFVERLAECDRVIVVGTPRYRQKYDNGDPMRPFVVAAEGDLIGKRMIGNKASQESVLPTLLDGTEETSFPPLLQGRVYADFRDPEKYFLAAFDLVLSLYAIPHHDPAVADLRETLDGSATREFRGS
ncbi:MAG: repeat-containing protein, partial [Planctomycetaceae bacterium]|nr:repeat-containing protein [Planctomycetaceae bacterium]